MITDKCLDCAGNGIVKGEEIISIKIPAGVSEGMQLSVGGKGNSAARSGVAGDLIVQIEELQHETLEREGNNLLYEHYITITDAALGTYLGWNVTAGGMAAARSRTRSSFTSVPPLVRGRL